MSPTRRTKSDVPMTSAQMLRTLNEGIRKQATRPNLYAYSPHAKQRLFHKSTKHKKLYIGGNRSGKSTGGVVEDIFWAMGRHPFRTVPPAPTYGRVCAVDFIQGVDKIILPEFARWVPPSFLKKGSFEQSYDKLLRTLTFENGSTIEFMSYDQALEKFAGTARHFTHYDEEPPHHIYNECEARLIDYNGTSWITMTPVEGMTWVFDDIYNKGKDGDHPDIEVVEVSIHDNPYVSEEAVERVLGSYDADERRARERGQFIELGGRVFKEFAKETHVVPFVLPSRDWEWYCSIDHGFNNPTAMLWHAVSPNNRVITFSEHYKSEMTVKEHAAVFHARNAGFDRIPDIVCGDPAMHQRSGITGSSIVQEYAEHGVYIATEGIPRDVQAGVNRMTQYLRLNPDNKAHWSITENCDALINELLRLHWQTWATRKGGFENNKKEKIHKKDDHAADSSRYFFTMLPDLTPEDIVDQSAMNKFARITAAVGNSTTPVPVTGRWDELLKNRVQTQWKTQEFGDLYGMEYD